VEEHILATQPWVTCYLTDMLLAYMRETTRSIPIDCAALFRVVEGFEAPPNPEVFLTDVSNWVPLAVLRELELQGERVSGRKDFAYHAARAYFQPGKRSLPSLFEIIVRTLNDVRSALIFANLWGAAQTNYLRLQSFEKSGAQAYMLAQFEETARPTVGTIHLLRGFCEGFPQLYPSIGEFECFEEISQLRLEDVVREFPDYRLRHEETRLLIEHEPTGQLAAEAVRIPVKSESVPVADGFQPQSADLLIIPEDGKIDVLAPEEELDPEKRRHATPAYAVVVPGTLCHDTLCHNLEKGQIYNAPYSRFRFAWKETLQPEKPISGETIRRQVSHLLFDHLRQIKQSHLRMVQYHIDKRRLTLENIHLRREVEREYSFAGIIGKSQKIKDLLDLVRSISQTDVTVIIQGETGTGKELIARAIHYNSARRAKRFVAINCGALSETLLESELFGHEKGAFTGASAQRKGIFEVADGGTLFLDEISEVSTATQVKLLRVLQEGELMRVGGNAPIKVDVRILAATNQNLEELVRNGRFRPDLFFRLNVFPIFVPPLRERIEDLTPLVFHFIEKNQGKLNRQVRAINPQALAALMAYRWPGNVRELENALQRMLIVSKGEILDLEDVPPEIRGKGTEVRNTPSGLKGIAKESAELVEKNTILEALSKMSGNITRTARALGISRATLQNKMKLYDLRARKR